MILFLLLGVFSLLALSASRRMSITYDETLHIAGAYTIRHLDDYRVNPEDPPLFMHWASLGLPQGVLDPSQTLTQWPEMLSNSYAHWPWVNDALFGRDRVLLGHMEMLAHVRTWMFVIAVVLGVVTVVLAHRLGACLSPQAARPAAIIAAVLFAFEPTLLGHSTLVKNDVALTLSYTLVVLALVVLVRRATWWSVVLLALAAAGGNATKFSGLLLGPSVSVILLTRAMLPAPWVVFSRELSSRVHKTLFAVALIVLCTVTTYAGIWSVYKFRYGVASDPAVQMDLSFDHTIGRVNAAWSKYTSPRPTSRQIDEEPVPAAIRAMTWASEHHLVPQPYAKGFNYTYGSTLLRVAFLMNQISFLGWWYYFPMCVLFKLPLGTMTLLVTGVVVAGILVYRRVRQEGVWGVMCRRESVSYVFFPPLFLIVFYMFMAMTGNFNIGIRHLLPIFAVTIACLSALVGYVLVSNPPKVLRFALLALLVATPVETLSSLHRYIAFFNLPSRMYGPERLLADSNLDWGQDLPLLAAWQKDHPKVTLSLSYFGPTTPEAYGLVFVPMQGTEYSRGTVVVTPPPGVVCLTATQLQEVSMKPPERGIHDIFRRLKPREVLGGTLFLYNWPPSREDLAAERWQLYFRRGNQMLPVPSVPEGAVTGP